MQGSRRTLVLRSAGLAIGALALLPASALADGVLPASPASDTADDTRVAYVVMLVLASLLAIGVLGALVSALRGGGEGSGGRRLRGTSGVQRIVGACLGALALGVFVFGIILTESVDEVEATAPTDGNEQAAAGEQGSEGLERGEPLRIAVTGQQWLWRYEYPDGTFSYFELVLPVDTPVALDLDSIDVNHRWWVPALAGMRDAIPGNPNAISFTPDETGVYEGASTEFSGPAYATMRTRVRIVGPAEYEAWLAEQATGIQDAQTAVQEQLGADAGGGEQ